MTLDDFMRAMWGTHGKPGGPQPGLVAKPYALTDMRDRLAEVSGDRAFAEDFYTRYMIGREVVDYARLLQRAGVVLRKRNAGRAWAGDVRPAPDGVNRIGNLQAPGTPAYEAGLEQDDRDRRRQRQAGRIDPAVQRGGRGTQARRSDRPSRSNAAAARDDRDDHAAEDPALEAVLIEDTGGTPTRGTEGVSRRLAGIAAAPVGGGSRAAATSPAAS